MTHAIALPSAQTIDRHLGAQLRRLRRAQRLSTQALGDRLGLTCQEIASYEAGLHRMTPAMLVKVAEILGVEVTELFQNQR